MRRTRATPLRLRLLLSLTLICALALSHGTLAQDDTAAPETEAPPPPPVNPETPPTTAPPAPTEPIATSQPPPSPTPSSATPATEAPDTEEPSATPSTSPTPSPSPSEAGGSSSGSTSTPTRRPPSPPSTRTRPPATSPTLAPTQEPGAGANEFPQTPVPSVTGAGESSSSGSASGISGDMKEGNSQTKSIVPIVVIGIGVVSVLGLLVMCCMRRNQEGGLEDLQTPLPQFATPAASGAPANVVYSDAKDDKVLTINTTSQTQGVQMNANQVPVHAITSPSVPSNPRGSTRISKLENRRTRSGTMNSTTSSAFRPSGLGEPRPSNLSQREDSVMRASDLSFVDRGESELDRGYSEMSFGSRFSDSSVEQPRITTNLNMHRFSQASTASSAQGGAMIDPSVQTVSFIDHDLTKSIDSSTMGSSLRDTNGSSATQSWYKSIQSPTEQDRYTQMSSDNDIGPHVRESNERESYEL